uniref:Uncharacterized protein n=1 Tax=Magallana gigas TaxID=29159 RepID=K1P6A9_MAGGI
MEQFDDYCTQLVSQNEARREENERNAHQLYNKLWLEEEKKREAVIRNSACDRIWRHHALMRQRGEEEWRRKMAKKIPASHETQKIREGHLENSTSHIDVYSLAAQAQVREDNNKGQRVLPRKKVF